MSNGKYYYEFAINPLNFEDTPIFEDTATVGDIARHETNIVKWTVHYDPNFVYIDPRKIKRAYNRANSVARKINKKRGK